MIYQLKLYYGALIGDKVIYSAELIFDDCTKLLTEPIDCEPLKNHIVSQIIKDDFNPNDFTFDWLTREQYENKIESKIDEQYNINEETLVDSIIIPNFYMPMGTNQELNKADMTPIKIHFEGEFE